MLLLYVYDIMRSHEHYYVLQEWWWCGPAMHKYGGLIAAALERTNTWCNLGFPIAYLPLTRARSLGTTAKL